MNEDRKLEAAAAEELRALEYPVVELQAASADGRSRARADILAWSPREDGQFGPTVLVEVKSPPVDIGDRRALSQLSALANLFGTERNYLYDGSWWLASPMFDRLHEVDSPPSALPIDAATSIPPSVVSRLIGQRIWRLADQYRGRRMTSETANSIIRDLRADEAGELDWLWADFGIEAVAPLLSFLTRAVPFGGEANVPFALAKSMARLVVLSDDDWVFDPFAGFGSILWGSQAVAAESGYSLNLYGMDRNRSAVDIASGIAEVTGAEGMRFEAGDWINDDMPGIGSAHVVSSPPIGWRLGEPRLLPWDRTTTDGEAYALYRIGAFLAPGHRAVILASRSFLTRSRAERIRTWLSSERRLVSIVGLPPGVLQATGIASALIVLENSMPGPTLVANLQDDWETQISPKGDFLREYLDHLGRRG